MTETNHNFTRNGIQVDASLWTGVHGGRFEVWVNDLSICCWEGDRPAADHNSASIEMHAMSEIVDFLAYAKEEEAEGSDTVPPAETITACRRATGCEVTP
mgnify:CR=1 FL=1